MMSRHAVNKPPWILFSALGLFLFGVVGNAAAQSLPPVDQSDAETRTKWLIDGTVLESESGEPISRFTVTPGTISIDAEGRSVIRWRDNLARTMNEGRLQWPRTSGFALMRFKVSADGYQDLTTQKIERGGPHIRLRVHLRRSLVR